MCLVFNIIESPKLQIKIIQEQLNKEYGGSE
jgi:hypothetical protein